MGYIVFKDFKLAVIQELMYKKELLTLKFDACDFAKSYQKRKIDLDEEGYEIIPEIRSYFEALEIEESLR